jgi:hypothetical protein
MANHPIIRTLIITALVLAVLLGVAWAALTIFLPSSRVREIVRTELTRQLDREVNFEDAGVSLFPPVRLTVRRPALAEPGGFEKGRVFEARSIHLDLDVLALLARRVVVRRLVVVDPRVHVVLHEDGTTNLDSLAKATPEEPGEVASAMEVAIQDLVIRGGGVLVDDFQIPRRTVFAVDSRLSLTASGDHTHITTSGETAISELSFGPVTARGRSDLSTGLAAITWVIEHEGSYDSEQNRLALDPLTIRFGDALIAFRGLVDDPGPKARMHLRTKGRKVDLGEVIKMLASADAAALQGISGTGQLDFDLDIRGILGTGKLPDLMGTVLVGDASFRYPDAPAAVEDLSFVARFAPDTLEIRSLTARVAGAGGGEATPVRARLLMTNLDEPEVVFAIQGDVDLATVAPMLVSRETRLAGRANIDLRGRGAMSNPAAFEFEGRARLSDASVESPDLPNPVQQIEGDFQFSRSHAKVTGLRAKTGQSSFKLDATIDGPLALLADPGEHPVTPARVSFDLESPYLDMNELMPAAPGSAPVLPNATGGGQVRIGRLRRDRLDVQDVTARVGLNPQRLTVPEFSFTGYQGTVAGSGSLDLANVENPVFVVDATATEVDADAFLSTWTPAKGLLRGTLSSDIDLSGAGLEAGDILPTLTALGLASLSSGSLGPGPAFQRIAEVTRIPSFATVQIRDGSIPFAVERGRVHVREVHLVGTTGDWKLAGSVGFDGSLDYAVSITLPAAIAAKLGSAAALAAGALRDDQGRVIIDLRVRGPAKSPEVSWDTDAMVSRLQGRVSEALQDLGKKAQTEGTQALKESVSGDSTAGNIQKRAKAFADSLEKTDVGDVIRGFFGKDSDD